MSSELRRAFRIALSFTAAFVLAESLHWDIQLTFIAPVIAGMLASGPAARVGTLLVLPILVWLLVTAAESAVGLMAGKPMLLGLFSLAVFHLAFRLHQDPSRATIGFLLLIVFAILPLNLIRAQELGSDLTRWFVLNFAVAAGCELITRTLLPDPGRPAAVARLPQLPPLASALALQVAVILTATIQPPAPGAVMIGVILVLRADGESAAHVVRDRFVAAFLGGAVAVAVWKVLWLAPSLPTLAGATFVGVFPFARRVARGGPGIGIAMKSINVLAILLGEGFSVLFDDADDRISTRIAGVIIGLVYAALVLLTTRRITARWREHRNGPAPDTRQFEPARAGRRHCDQGLPRRPATSDRPTPAESTECHPQHGKR
jgi:hypothetical protein